MAIDHTRRMIKLNINYIENILETKIERVFHMNLDVTFFFKINMAYHLENHLYSKLLQNDCSKKRVP